MQILSDTLTELALGLPACYRNLAVFPLIASRELVPGYVTLDEALARNGASIAEVSEDGHVPELRLANRLDERLLLVDGEELVGAKQNRVLNLSILVDARRTVIIPVSCVEHGRWQYRGHRFDVARRKLYGSLRAKKMAAVTVALRTANARHSDQQQIWRDIAHKSERMESRSETGAVDALYDRLQTSTAEFTAAFATMPAQVGAVFTIDERVAGIELFDSPATFRHFFSRLVESYALDALEEPVRYDAEPPTMAVQAFLERVLGGTATRHPAVDLGEDLRLTGDGLTGGALVVDGRVVHFSAFELATLPSSSSLQ